MDEANTHCFHCGIDFENEKSGGQRIRIGLIDGDTTAGLDFHPSCFHEIAGAEYYDELQERRKKEILFREERKFNISRGKKPMSRHDFFGKMQTSNSASFGLIQPPPRESITVTCEDCGAPALVKYCEKCVAKRVVRW